MGKRGVEEHEVLSSLSPDRSIKNSDRNNRLLSVQLAAARVEAGERQERGGEEAASPQRSGPEVRRGEGLELDLGEIRVPAEDSTTSGEVNDGTFVLESGGCRRRSMDGGESIDFPHQEREELASSPNNLAGAIKKMEGGVLITAAEVAPGDFGQPGSPVQVSGVEGRGPPVSVKSVHQQLKRDIASEEERGGSKSGVVVMKGGYEAFVVEVPLLESLAKVVVSVGAPFVLREVPVDDTPSARGVVLRVAGRAEGARLANHDADQVSSCALNMPRDLAGGDLEGGHVRDHSIAVPTREIRLMSQSGNRERPSMFDGSARSYTGQLGSEVEVWVCFPAIFNDEALGGISGATFGVL